MAETFPLHVVTAWLGNSQLIAAKHYLQVTDEHFAKATHNQTHSAAEMSEPDGIVCLAVTPVIKKPRISAAFHLVPLTAHQKSTPDRSRTCDLRFRKPSLYPTELREQIAQNNE